MNAESSWALGEEAANKSPWCSVSREMHWSSHETVALAIVSRPCDWQEIKSAWRQHPDLCNCTSERRGHATKVCLIALKEEIWRAGLWLNGGGPVTDALLHAALQQALSRPLPVCNRIKADTALNGWKATLSIWFLLLSRDMIFTSWFSQEFYNEI